jgi:hypothetical protein
MANIITDYDSVKSKHFTLKNSHYYSDQYKTLEIKYDSNNFFIQTPYIINRYSPSNYESKITLDIPLDFSNITENSIDDISILYKLFIRIHKTIKNKVSKTLGEDFKYSNCVKKNKKNLKCPFLKTKIHSVENKIFLKVFKSDKTISENQEIKSGKEIRFILHLESIWVYKKSFGINWYIVQAEVKLPNILHSYSFDNNLDTNIISQHKDYKKFFKMVNMGVPKEAVKIKMNLEGFNCEIIDMEPTTLSKTALKKNNEMLGNIPPPPPPPPSLGGSLPVKINPQDLQKVKLKKTIVKPKEKMEEAKDLRIPTKNQLLEQLKKLKKNI